MYRPQPAARPSTEAVTPLEGEWQFNLETAMRELLTNAINANAAKIIIQITTSSRVAQLAIQDDGTGFKLQNFFLDTTLGQEKANWQHGLHIVSMLSGDITIISSSRGAPLFAFRKYFIPKGKMTADTLESYEPHTLTEEVWWTSSVETAFDMDNELILSEVQERYSKIMQSLLRFRQPEYVETITLDINGEKTVVDNEFFISSL